MSQNRVNVIACAGRDAGVARRGGLIWTPRRDGERSGRDRGHHHERGRGRRVQEVVARDGPRLFRRRRAVDHLPSAGRHVAQRLGVGEARRQLQLGQALLDMGAGGVASREDLLGRGALLDHHVHELVEEAVHHRRVEAGRNQALVLGPRDLSSTQLDAIVATRL